MGSEIVANPIFLGWSYYIDKPDEISNVYKIYLEDSIKIVEFFMERLNREHAGIDKTTPRGQAEHLLLEQTKKITRQIQSVLEKEQETYKETYKKPPRTLLDPSGKAYDAFVRRHTSAKKKEPSRKFPSSKK